MMSGFGNGEHIVHFRSLTGFSSHLSEWGYNQSYIYHRKRRPSGPSHSNCG